jgi:hypothetical protein
MGSASQQLSQLIDSGSLSPSLAYLLLCDAIFWVLATCALQREFAMKDLEPLHLFHGIIVERRSDGLFLHQRTYMLDILKRAVMADCKPCTTPGEVGRGLGASR